MNVPGGPASVRRLLRLDSGRPPATFFRDVHEVLLFEGELQADWPEVESRRTVVEFAENLLQWRREFGASAVFSASSKEGEKDARRALAWLGMKVEGAPGSWTTESRTDRESLSRRRFFDAIGTPIPVFLSRLRAGERVVVAPRDEPALLPFGLPAWRQILREPNLTAGDAFLYFVKNVKASRMLVAADSLDAETLEELGAVAGGGGSVAALRVLYERALEPFARFHEAISLHAGRFELPGGREADPIWADVFGVSPSEPGRFLRALYEKDSGKGAYVVDVLQQLPDGVARALVLSPEGFGPRSFARFRRLYRSIEDSGEGIALARRDPDDFGHLARFLRLSAEGDLALSGADLDGETFPRSETELREIVAPGRRRPAQTGDVLARLFRVEPGRQGGSTAGRRFLVVSSLIEIRPDLQEPGLVALLLRGVDRFFPAYAVLQDVPVDPALARRYLFALDRLDRRRDSRASEVACGLFQTGAELLAQLARSNALAPAEIRDLFSAYLDLPLFAEESVGPADGAKDLLSWLSDRLLPALRAAERGSIDARRAENARREEAYRSTLRAHGAAGRAGQADAARWLLEPICPPDDEFIGPMPARIVEERRRLADTEEQAEKWIEEALAIERTSHERIRLPARLEVPEESATADELLARALVGPSVPARVEWRGGRYLFDPTTDELSRRREFRERQRIASLEDVEGIRRARGELLAAAGRGDADSAREVIRDLAIRLQVAQSPDAAPADRRPSEEDRAAREFVADALRVPGGAPGALPRDVRALDGVVAGRALEAMLGHVYAITAGDPEDLYYQDPDFVRRHSFRRVEKGGKVLVSPFGPTTLAPRESGGGSRVSGSVFGLPDVLGLLHAEQIPYNPGAFIGNEQIRSGLVGPVRRMSPARIDDDAMAFVAASCRAAEELAVTLTEKDERERFRSWRDLARDLVPRSRLARLAKLGPGEASGEALAEQLSPTDLYRIGRRIALGSAPSSASGAAREAKAALDSLREKFGEAGARERLAEFGPQAVAYAGRLRLTDLDLPSYERLAAYRTPQLFSDRLYDLKISAARAVSDARLPAAVLPAVLPGAVDRMLSDVKMAFAFDWRSLVRRAHAFDTRELDFHLDEALRAGRLIRDQNADPFEERQ